MELINIKYIRDTHEVILYFKHHCIRANATWQTYNLYCEFHNITIYQGELVMIERPIEWNKDFKELIAL